ncbi:MAG TPA: DNA-processing protein DprA [Micromonosporaceae bacterium]|jgi:DNA processing protein
MTDSTRLARIALSGLVEPGSRDMGDLVDLHGPIEALARLRYGDAPPNLLTATAMRRSTADPITVAARMLERTERLGARVITPEDDEWPAQLDDLRRISVDGRRADKDVYPPLCIWLRGPIRLDDAVARSVAVVGSRASSPYGNHVALELAYGLAERAWHVVSGGAFGIDAQAHRGAMTGGGVTVAVLACGVDRAYPAAHANMFDRIVDDGLVVSEWPPGADPHRHRFLIRNRVIAALTRGTVVVEASARSGAKQTAARALQLGRRTMAVPGPVTSAMSVGTHQLLRVLETRLVTSAAEIIEEVGRIGDDLATVERGPERDRDRLDPEIAQVLDGVPARNAAGPGEIAAAAGVALRVAIQALPLLKTMGFVVEDGGRWRLAPRRRAA